MNNKYKYDFTLVCKRIATARKMAGMTQDQVARCLKVGVNHLSEIERGVAGISVGTLIELVKILRVSSDYILFGVDLENSPLNINAQTISPYQKLYLEEIINNFITCCSDERCFPKHLESDYVNKQ